MTAGGVPSPAGPPSVAVVVLAYNAVHLLRQCVENVLLRTSEATTEIIVWDNASTDGTGAYLDGLHHPRLRVVRHGKNIGLNGYAKAFPMTTASHLVVLDQDVIDAPPAWDRALLDAYTRLPGVGFLAANQVDDPNSLCARIMHHDDAHLYSEREVNGVALLDGPTGGWCAMTSREVHDRVGGFPFRRNLVYFHFDGLYIAEIEKLGYTVGILRDLEVFHASGPYYAEFHPEKHAYYARLHRRRAAKDLVKRVIVRVPLVRSMNEKHKWFTLPAAGAGD